MISFNELQYSKNPIAFSLTGVLIIKFDIFIFFQLITTVKNILFPPY